MVLMAIDHAAFFIARVHPAETWAAPPPYYADVPAFLTRWLTHLCAPGSVSYTHLTLPTRDLVSISVVAVSLKKKTSKEYVIRFTDNPIVEQ